MKLQMKISIIASLLIIPIKLFSQDFTVTNIHGNDVFIGIDNPIKVFTQEVYDTLIVSTDNGSLISIDNHTKCWRPISQGEGLIVIKGVKMTDTSIVGTMRFDVQYIEPSPVLVYTDSVKQEELITLSRIYYRWPDSITLCGGTQISSYSLMIIRNNRVNYQCSSQSFAISKRTRKAFRKTKPDDVIILYNVVFIIGTRTSMVGPVQYIVK